MNMISSTSLSLVVSFVWVGVFSFVSVRFMSSLISFSRVPMFAQCQRWFPVAGYHRSLFPKTLMFAVKVTCKYDVARPKQNPSMIFLEGSFYGTVQC